MGCYKFTTDLLNKERLLEDLGVVEYVEVDDEGVLSIFFESDEDLKSDSLVSMDVDWNKQSEQHSEYYCSDGYMHFPMGKDRDLLLLPGEGFGDLSHPTTLLTLELMRSEVYGEKVLDIGSGSGVLSLAASIWGAQDVLGIDIDPEAVAHANINLEVNALKNISFDRSDEEYLLNYNPSMIVINMITSEQDVVWLSYPQLGSYRNIVWIISGILLEQKDEYLLFAERRGWILQKDLERDGWIGFIFHS